MPCYQVCKDSAQTNLRPVRKADKIVAESHRHRVIVTSHHVRRVLPERRAELDAAGVELFFPPLPRPQLNEAELLTLAPGCSAAIAMPDAYTARVFDAAPTLRLVARTGVGFDSIDLDAATKHGVWVTSTPGSNHESVADFTLGLLLCLTRKLVETINQTRSGPWVRMSGMELAGKTLGVAGTGRVGRAVVQRARAFGLRIIAYDLYPDATWAAAQGVTYVTLEDLFARSDILTLHAPANAESHHLVNAATLALCKRGIYLINTARGDLVDEPALLAALQNGQVAGAALDVFTQEPPSDRRLLEHPLVLPLSHSAGGTAEAHVRAANMALDEVLRVLSGKRPLWPANDLPTSGA